MIRLTQNEMRALGRESEGVRLTDGSGYLGQLTVYHNLHCVVSLQLSLPPKRTHLGQADNERPGETAKAPSIHPPRLLLPQHHRNGIQVASYTQR